MKGKSPVRAKKHLGQHFLVNDFVAENIAGAITFHCGTLNLLEIGPGTGALTRHLIPLTPSFKMCELDGESIEFLKKKWPDKAESIIQGDFLLLPPESFFRSEAFIVAGNFPYNISSQILFRVLDMRIQVTELVGMFQREVALRIASPPGSKEYGILSVLLRAFYNISYLFTVSEQDFHPPPKVKSGVIRMVRNSVERLGCDEAVFKRVVKTAFNQRRKTLRNSLRGIMPPDVLDDPIFDKRPEQLDVDGFVILTNMLP